MQVILLERVENLGQMGDVVTVRPGYARNFLLPRQKALRATKDNISYFDGKKKELEAQNLKRREEAEKVSVKMEGLKVSLIRQASEAGQLYGSVTARDIADAVTDKGFKIDREQVTMDRAYKLLGLYPVKVFLHPEVMVEVTINIARSAEEAKIQEERGEALIVKDDRTLRAEERAAEAAAALEAQAAAEAAKAAEGEKTEEAAA
ncbi:MAG TPA: 50S ribosomal protein L9 [Alphaproteobacteria bacterium]|nr:50S ribosomal protein L9 [Rhodospirillaceae bacterium]HRJ65702.1 50S ribosomal protein L9 [Alphaproteobacteria bacterium]